MSIVAIHCPNLNLTQFVSANNTVVSNNITSVTTVSSVSTNNNSHFVNNVHLSSLKEENNKMDTIVHFECNQQGTILVGSNLTKCLANGHWSESVPTCKGKNGIELLSS